MKALTLVTDKDPRACLCLRGAAGPRLYRFNGSLGEGGNVYDLRSPLVLAPKRVLSRRLSRGGLIGLESQYTKILNANQD